MGDKTEEIPYGRKSFCKHCNKPIKYIYGIIWHELGEIIFPQYCKNDYDENGCWQYGGLHEPLN